MKCKKCNKEIKEGVQFCESCGTKVKATSVRTSKQNVVKGLAVIVIIVSVVIIVSALSSPKSNKDESALSTTQSIAPTNVELASYVKTVLDDHISNYKTSSYYKDDWKFITNNNLRYKIETKIEYMNLKPSVTCIITFEDDTYQNYTVNHLQIDKTVLVQS